MTEFAEFHELPPAAPISENPEAVARPYTAGTDSPWVIVTPEMTAAPEAAPEVEESAESEFVGVVAAHLASHDRRELRDRIFICAGLSFSLTAATLLLIDAIK